jgi:DNA ligase 1
MRPLLLAHVWDPAKVDPTGYYMSDKLDGVRAWWDGSSALWSRLGKQFVKAPPALISRLPQGVELDGELYLGPGRFNDTIRAIKGSAGWGQIRYVVFDAPHDQDSFERRQAVAQRFWTDVAPQVACESTAHLLARLDAVQSVGGEGVMLRQPGSLYEGKRSRTLLKVKTFFDVEGTVVGHIAGKGKHQGRLGALACRLDSGVAVDVGTGLTDAERESPPTIGARVTIKYQELTPAGVPRFPVYVSERNYE